MLRAGGGTDRAPSSSRGTPNPRIERFRLLAEKDPRWLVTYSRCCQSPVGKCSSTQVRKQRCLGASKTTNAEGGARSMTSFARLLSIPCGSTEKDTHKRGIWLSALGEELPTPNFARAMEALSTSSGTGDPTVQGRFSHTLAGAGVKEFWRESCLASFSKGSLPGRANEGLRAELINVPQCWRHSTLVQPRTSHYMPTSCNTVQTP